MWIGQNEMTNEFGKFIKSQTNPLQSKIPFAATLLLSPGHEGASAMPNGRNER